MPSGWIEGRDHMSDEKSSGTNATRRDGLVQRNKIKIRNIIIVVYHCNGYYYVLN